MNVRLDEWSALALLLERGIPLEDALSLAFRDSDPYQKRLRQGKAVLSMREGRETALSVRCPSS